MALSRINQPSSNPYSVGAIQLDTTPFANLYIQQRQREQAKDEALDKYFMDYDKSINPAGMRNVEAQDLIRLTNENKDFYFKNKANIKNPALDNGKSYNEWMSRNKTALGLVNQSKQNAQKEQLYNKAILDAKKSGNPIPDSTIEKLARFNKSVYDKDYRDIDANDLDFTPKPFDPIKFKRDNYSDIKLSESAPEITVDDKNNQLTIKTVSKLDKANVPVLEQRAALAYNSSPSVKYQVDKIIHDPIQLMSLNKVYQKYKGKDVNVQQPEEVAAALLLSLGDTEKVDYVSKNDPKAMAYLSNQLISGRIQQNAANNYYNPRRHVEEIYNNGSEDIHSYPIKNGVVVKGREIAMPDVLQDKYYDKADGRVRRPDKVIMDDDKKNIHLIFFNGTEPNGQPRVDQKKSRSIPVTTDVIPDLEKSFGNPKKNLSFGTQSVPSSKPSEPQKGLSLAERMKQAKKGK